MLNSQNHFYPNIFVSHESIVTPKMRSREDLSFFFNLFYFLFIFHKKKKKIKSKIGDEKYGCWGNVATRYPNKLSKFQQKLLMIYSILFVVALISIIIDFFSWKVQDYVVYDRIAEVFFFVIDFYCIY